MGFLEEYYNPVETVTMEYRYTNRFLQYIFPATEKPMKMEFEANMAIDREIEMIKSGVVKIPRFPVLQRELCDYNLEVKSTVILCMRITNVCKALHVLKKYDREKSARMIEKLSYVKDVLQEEYKEVYNEYYNPLLNSQSKYKAVHDNDMTFAEYMIHKDLYNYFDGRMLNNYGFYAKNKRALHQYMSLIYISIELEMLSSDMNHDLSAQKDELDFVQHYSLSQMMEQEIKALYDDFDMYEKRIDTSSVADKILKHKLFIMPEKGGKLT